MAADWSTPLLPVLLLAVLLALLPSGGAGTPDAPEVEDARGDTAAALDLVAAWVTTDAANVTFHLRLAQLPSPPAPTQHCTDAGCMAAALAFLWEFESVTPNGTPAPGLPGYNGTFLVYRHGPVLEDLRTGVGYLGPGREPVLLGNASVELNGTEVAMTLPRSHAALALPNGTTPGPYRIRGLVASSSPQLCEAGVQANGEPAGVGCEAPPSVRAGLGGVAASEAWDRAPDAGTGVDFVFPSPPPQPTVTLTETATRTLTTTLPPAPAPQAETFTVTHQPFALVREPQQAPGLPAVAVLGLLALVALARRAC